VLVLLQWVQSHFDYSSFWVIRTFFGTLGDFYNLSTVMAPCALNLLQDAVSDLSWGNCRPQMSKFGGCGARKFLAGESTGNLRRSEIQIMRR